jgi:hypothetical protein
MSVDDILALWKEDTEIDSSNLLVESLKIPQLHHKYLKLYYAEQEAFLNLEKVKKEAMRVKSEYYRGNLSAEELKMYGWEPFNQRLLKDDIYHYIESDSDIIKLNLKISLQKEKTQLLHSIITSINNRNFTIKNSIDWLRWSNGS